MLDQQQASSPEQAQNQMMQFMQEMIELHQEKNELRRNISGASKFSWNTKKPDRPLS